MLQGHQAFLALAAQNLEHSKRFYQTFLDQPPTVDLPDRYAEFQLGSLRLAIFHPKAQNAGEFSAASSGAMSLCLEVEDLERAIAAVLEAYATIGLDPVRSPSPTLIASHGREAYAYDPDGNRLILHEATRKG